MFANSRLRRVRPAACQLAFFVCLLIAPHVHAADPFEDQVLPFVKSYCVQCHNAKKASGELDLTRYTSASKILEDFRQWEHVVAFLKKEEMPPAKAKQPTPAERAAILTTLESVLVKAGAVLEIDVPTQAFKTKDGMHSKSPIPGNHELGLAHPWTSGRS